LVFNKRVFARKFKFRGLELHTTWTRSFRKKIKFKELERKMSKIKLNFGPKTIGIICGYAC